MYCAARLEDIVIFSTAKGLYRLNKIEQGKSGEVEVKALWTTAALNHGINVDDRILLGCACGHAPSGRTVLVLLLGDKSVVLVWLLDKPLCSSGVLGEFYMLTSTYRKASAASINNGMLFVADRFGGLYSQDLAQLEADDEGQNSITTPLKQAKQFTLAEPSCGRCTTITSLSVTESGTVYFSDRDGVIVETQSDSLSILRNIWTSQNTYTEQAIAWDRHGVISYGDVGVFYNPRSDMICRNVSVLIYSVTTTPDEVTMDRCIGMAATNNDGGCTIYAAVVLLSADTKSRKYTIRNLRILKLTMSNGAIQQAEALSYPLGMCIREYQNAPNLRELSRGDILQAYSISSLQVQSTQSTEDDVPLFIDSRGTLFYRSRDGIRHCENFLHGDIVVAAAKYNDSVIVEHAMRSLKQ